MSNIWDALFGSAITANKVLASPNGSSGPLTPRALVAADLPAGTGTVTSVTFTGDGTVLSSTPSSAVTTTGTLTAALASAAGGTVLGRNATTSGAPSYTIAPVLGIPGTSNGTLALASSTASGKFTIATPASAATPTLTLPTTSNVLAGQFAGDGVLFNTSLAVASAAGTLTPVLLTQTANFVLAGPTTGAAAAPTFRALVTADMPAGTGTVTSVAQSFTGGLISVGGSPITTSGTLALTVAGTSGGIPYFSGTASWASSALLASGGLVLGGGSGTAPLTNTQLTFSAPTLTVGLAGTSSGILALTGSTSGQATITAPAIAGTTSNKIAISNAFTVPVCTLALGPSIGCVGGSPTGINFTSTSLIDILFNASVSRFAFDLTNNKVFIPSGGVYGFSSNSTNPSAASDLALSRITTNTVGIGTGANGNTGGNLQLAKITSYNAVATVSGGVPAEYATVDLTAQSAAITSTTLYAVPAAGQGMYRISWCAAITTADGAASVLGGTTGFQITYTDPADSVVKTSPRTVTAGVDTDSTNTTATAISGVITVFAKLSTNISYQMGYTSTTPGQMVYTLHIKCEAL